MEPESRDRYRMLLEASRRLAATLGAEELYRAIHIEASRMLEASGFYLALCDQSRDVARIVYYVDNGEARMVDLPFRASDSEVFRTREACLVNDHLKEGSLQVLGDEDTETARSAVIAPIVHNERLIVVRSRRRVTPRAPTTPSTSTSFGDSPTSPRSRCRTRSSSRSSSVAGSRPSGSRRSEERLRASSTPTT